MSKKTPKYYMYSMRIPLLKIWTAIEDVTYYVLPDQITVQASSSPGEDFRIFLFRMTKSSALLLEQHFETYHGFKTKAKKVKEAKA